VKISTTHRLPFHALWPQVHPHFPKQKLNSNLTTLCYKNIRKVKYKVKVCLIEAKNIMDLESIIVSNTRSLPLVILDNVRLFKTCYFHQPNIWWFHKCHVAETRWAKSQSKSEIPSRTIVEGEIVVGAINCPVADTKWVGSQSNHRIIVFRLLHS